MTRAERLVRWFDDVQLRRRPLGHLVGTVRKYADDRGSALAGLVTYQLFLGLLPLLVVVLTILGSIAGDSEAFREALLGSTLGQLPVVGDRLREDVRSLSASGAWVVVSVVALLWTAAGAYHALQLAMNQVWNVEGTHRQGFLNRHIRAVLLFALIVVAALGTGLLRRTAPLPWQAHPAAEAAAAVAGAAVAAALLVGVLRLATSPVVPTARLVPAAALAGLLWELIQRAGTWLVVDRVAQATDLYGTIGLVVVTLGWINLLARSVVYAAEWAVVSWDGLWPRRIAQPPLTDADREVLERLARNERRRPEQHVEVTFDREADRS